MAVAFLALFAGAASTLAARPRHVVAAALASVPAGGGGGGDEVGRVDEAKEALALCRPAPSWRDADGVDPMGEHAGCVRVLALLAGGCRL